MELEIETNNSRQVIDITDKVQRLVKAGNNLVNIFAAHTTCGVTTADLDPGADKDLAEAVWEMIPKLDFSRHHDPEHFPSHIIHSVIGPNVTVPVKGGRLVLGTWQKIVLIEMDGPKKRNLYISVC
ncbi:MAG: secondary thiamine-phosphate synthase enzyme YjbQ [Candidatus Saccharimonadales bacterium]